MSGVTVAVTPAQAASAGTKIRVVAMRLRFPPFPMPRQRAVIVTPSLRLSNTSLSAIPADDAIGVCVAVG